MEKSENIFSSLIEENKDKIYRICCYYVSGEEDRKDLYQEVLLNLWKGFKSFREDATFSTWAFRITVNTSLHFISKQRSLQKKNTQYTNLVASQDNFNERNVQDEISILNKGISQLPLIDMIIISLVLEEVNSKEIAKIIGITESNVRVRLHRAKENLKKIIEGGES